MKKKLTCLILTLVMLISPFYPLMPQAAMAAAVAELDMDALTALGIDTSQAPDGYDPYNQDNPYGKNTIQVAPVAELYKVGLSSGVDYSSTYSGNSTLQDGRNTAQHTRASYANTLQAVLYGHEKWDKSAEFILKNVNGTNKDVASGTMTTTGDYTQISTGTIEDTGSSSIPFIGYLKGAVNASADLGDGFKYAMSSVAAGNFDKNEAGLKAQAVMVYTSDYSNQGGLYLRFGDIVTGDYGTNAKQLLGTDKKIGNPNLTYEGEPVENFAENPYQLQNYLQVATGDWNNDGLDEIAVYIPEENNSRIVVFALQLTGNDDKATAFKNPDKWQVVWNHYLREDNVVSNMVSLTSGDVNRDGVDDLAATWGYYYGPEQNKGSRAVVMFGAKGTQLLQKWEEFNVNFGSSNIVRASFAFGDMAGGNEKALILAGQSDADLKTGNTQTRYVAMYHWNGAKFEVNIQQNFDLFEQEDGVYTWTVMGGRLDADENPLDVFYSLPLTVANTAVIPQGVNGGGDLLYFDSLLIEYTDEGLALREAWDNTNAMQTNPSNPAQYVEYSAVAGDLTGNTGAASFMTMMQTLAIKDTFGSASYDLEGEFEVPRYERRFYYKNWFYKLFDIKTWYTAYLGMQIVAGTTRMTVEYPKLEMGKAYLVTAIPADNGGLKNPHRTQEDFSTSICIANTDADSSYMSYDGKHYYTYTDPEVLAVLASPPYFADLLNREDLSGNYAESTTSYASTKGSGSGSTTSATLTVGAYVSFEQEFSVFGVKVASVEAEATITAGFTWETETTSTLEQTIEYTAAAGEDMVAFYSIPMEIYEYTSHVPDGKGNYEQVLTTVNIPHEAAIRLLSLEEYEFIAKDYSVLPTIADNVLTHENGNPASYPASTAGYNVITEYVGTPTAVGFSGTGGGAAIRQELAMTKENNKAFSVSGGIEAKAGAGAGGVTVGVIAGFEGGAGSVEITTSGSSFSGEMQSMPVEAQPYGYAMNWKIFAYRYASGGSNFPVVSYLVSGVQNPPPLPDDFSQNIADTTENSITLDWSYDGHIAGFRILRYYEFPEGSGSQEVTFVPFTAGAQDETTGQFSFSYTDENLNPYTEYQYQIKAVRATNPKESIYSEPLVCRTKTTAGYPVMTLLGLNLDGVLPIYPDANSTVTLNITEPEKYNSLSYQWQKQIDGNWVNLSGRTEKTFTISNAGAADASLYRCRVNAIYYDVGAAQEYYISAYSDVFGTAYAKRTALVNLKAEATTTGLQQGIQADIEVYSGNSGHSAAPSGNVTFIVTGTDYEYRQTKPLDAQSTAKPFTGFAESKLYSTAALTLPNLSDGVYSVRAYYSGSRIFRDNELMNAVLVVIGNGTAHRLDLLSSQQDGATTTTRFTYGDNIYSKLMFIKQGADGVTLAPVEGVTYELWASEAKTGVPFESGALAPDVGSYTLEAYAGGDLLATQVFTVAKKPITVAVENKSNVDSGTVSNNLPKMVGTGLSQEALAELKLIVVAFNSAGNRVTLDNNTEAGSYRVVASTSDATPTLLYDNYSVTYQPGTYIIIGATHWLTAEALDYTSGGATRPVGTVGISGQTGKSAKYTAGSNVLLYATPQAGYEVDTWTATFANNSTPPPQVGGTTFVIATEAQAVDITVTFKPITIKLMTSVQPADGGVITCDDGTFGTGAIVSSGAEYKFTATPMEGYHFKQWRIVSGGSTVTEAGEAHEGGSNSHSVTVGTTSTTVYADFERDPYTLTIEGDITAYYWHDHDGLPGTDPIKRTIASGSEVTGGTLITVEPLVGYSAAPEAFFTLNGLDTTEREKLVFPIIEDSTVSLTTVRNSYAVTVEGNNGTVTTTVDGTPTANDQLDSVLGGSQLRFTARADRSFIFSHWLVNSVNKGSNAILTIAALGEPTEIEAVFESNTPYTATAVTAPVERGTISYTLYDIYGAAVETAEPMPEILTVYAGESITFTANVIPGSMVEQWQVNGTNDYTNRRTYNVEAITGDLQITAYLKAASSYAVHYGVASEPLGGSLSATSDRQPFVSNSILYGGSDLIFTATPEAGYMLDHWTITSGDLATPEATKSVDANGRVYVEPIYNISPLNRHLTVRAYFRALQSWDVTLPADSDMGTAQITSVTPVDPTDSGARSGLNAVVRDGGTVKMLFSPLPGYDTSVAELQAIVTEAANAGAHVVVTQAADDYQVIVSNLTQELDLSSVEPYHALYAVTVAPADHGSVIPSTTLARAGTEITLTVAPASGYRLSSLTLEPSSVILDPPVAAGTLLYTFAMPEESVTVTATFQLIPAPPPPPPPPSSGDGGGSVVEPPYVFSQGGSGTHRVQATAGLIPEIVTAKARGATSFILDITGQLADAEETDVLTVTIPENIVKHLANLDLVMQTPYGDLGLSGQLVAALAAADEGIAITLQAGDMGEVADELGAADELLSQPVDITTSLRGDIQVTLDCSVVLPEDADERAAFLTNLYVLAIHASDDVEQIGELEFTIDEETNTLTAISFRVERFSTFALALTGQEQPQPVDSQRLSTVIDGRDYVIDGVNKLFDQLTAYRTGDDVTVMAVRLLQELGAQIGYKRVDNVGVVTVIYGDITATLREQATMMTVATSEGTRQVTLRTVFTNRDGRTYLPTRDVAENLGFFVKWAAADDSITVTN